MKQLALLNSNRRSTSFRDGAGEGPIKSPAVLFWVIIHGLCCLISLVLGFRFSRLVFFLLFSTTSTTTTIHTAPFYHTLTKALGAESPPNQTTVGSRVVVGRHGILVRPWPHPNLEQVVRAHRILERVQKEQRVQYGVKNPRSLIVITPTYVRTFQALHLSGVMHSLMNVPYEVVWIVVEAGGVSNETAGLIRKSGIETIHIGFDQKMPGTWADRPRVEDLMRLRALRLVRDRKLDGIVMFADDSNMHSLELFDEVQRVKWIGAVSVGILVHSGDPDEPLQVEKADNDKNYLPIQGPACNSSENLVGWYTFNTLPYAERSAAFIGDTGTVLPRKMEWAGFVLNSRLLWNDESVDKPKWMKDLDSLGEESVESPLSLLKDLSVVEPLGSCGRKVLLWWLRVEARADSKFPSGWVINTPLEITVPAKHTPWPEIPPELPANTQVTSVKHERPLVEDHIIANRPPKTRPSRKRGSRSKKKRDTRMTDSQTSSRHQGDK